MQLAAHLISKHRCKHTVFGNLEDDLKSIRFIGLRIEGGTSRTMETNRQEKGQKPKEKNGFGYVGYMYCPSIA
jgi:hypothetical protein